MKICPVCNDSFADQLNFCDVDGTRLIREASVQERNKWWSLLGAGLVVGALVISAASIIFLPRARVSSPVVTSEPPSSPVPPKAPSAESTASVAVSAVTPEPESVSTDAAVPDVKKKDKALANADAGGTTPNPKAAALAAEGAEKKAVPVEGNSATPAPKKPEAPPAVKSAAETHSADAATKPQTPPDMQKDQKTQAATAKSHDKDSKDKKKDDEKKKGGFLRVFKKIFGKD